MLRGVDMGAFLAKILEQRSSPDWSSQITTELVQMVLDEWKKAGITNIPLTGEQVIAYGKPTTFRYNSNIGIVARVIFAEICDAGEYSGSKDNVVKRAIALKNANAVAQVIANRLILWHKYRNSKEVVLDPGQFNAVDEKPVNVNYRTPLRSGYIRNNPYLPELWLACVLLAVLLEQNLKKEIPDIYGVDIGKRPYYIDFAWVSPKKYPFFSSEKIRCQSLQSIAECAVYYRGTDKRFYKLQGKLIVLGKNIYYDYKFE
jgi:hypothetical protein